MTPANVAHTPVELAEEALRIQEIVRGQRGAPVLRTMGSLAVWQYARGVTDFLERTHRVPRDIDFVFAKGRATQIARAFASAGYKSDSRLLVESQGRKIHAESSQFNVDAYADPLSFRQDLRLGKRLGRCQPAISLTDLLLLKFQIAPLGLADQIDLCALLATSYARSNDACSGLDRSRLEEILGSSWRWWNATRKAIAQLESTLATGEMGVAVERQAIDAQISIIRDVMKNGPKRFLWYLARLLRYFLPSANEVDET